LGRGLGRNDSLVPIRVVQVNKNTIQNVSITKSQESSKAAMQAMRS
jgi:hypothetical protein